MTDRPTALIGEYLDINDIRYPRTQREAGIEFQEWDDRLKPLRPWWHEIAALIFISGMCAIMWLVFAVAFGR